MMTAAHQPRDGNRTSSLSGSSSSYRASISYTHRKLLTGHLAILVHLAPGTVGQHGISRPDGALRHLAARGSADGVLRRELVPPRAHRLGFPSVPAHSSSSSHSATSSRLAPSSRNRASTVSG